MLFDLEREPDLLPPLLRLFVAPVFFRFPFIPPLFLLLLLLRLELFVLGIVLPPLDELAVMASSGQATANSLPQ
jgi:hypothetical protein